ncbi:SDR family NAD(P)-dependent oxidoreductase [Crateriforma spongiae]|uniref:SDR family NAD(P)-dependent oxidoreductase n=1 Tax=Crateriforma spongiae TaxID=2724528 RepID=UPI001444C8C4|nr:SDR family NAD(P)-dependent oxidoreductase [Crateriforma spongiae]
MWTRWNPDGSTAIVTGASSGVGYQFCRLATSKGCRVVAVARRLEKLEQLLQDCPKGAVRLVPGDITSNQTCDSAIETVQDWSGGQLDLLVNNAGIGAIGPFVDASPDRLRRIMEVNFFAATEWTRRCLPSLLRGRNPVVCHVGSVLGHCGVPNKSEYCASKFALHGWHDAICAELRGTVLRSTLVSPSTTRSEFFDSLIDSDPAQRSVSVGSWPPEKVAREMFHAIVRRRREVVCSVGGKALVWADRLFPGMTHRILSRTAK